MCDVKMPQLATYRDAYINDLHEMKRAVKLLLRACKVSQATSATRCAQARKAAHGRTMGMHELKVTAAPVVLLLLTVER